MQKDNVHPHPPPLRNATSAPSFCTRIQAIADLPVGPVPDEFDRPAREAAEPEHAQPDEHGRQQNIDEKRPRGGPITLNMGSHVETPREEDHGGQQVLQDVAGQRHTAHVGQGSTGQAGP